MEHMNPAVVVALVSVVNLTFFFVTGGLFHWAFTRLPADRWKHQPKKAQTRRMMLEKLPLVLVNGVILNLMMGSGVAFGARVGRAYWSPLERGLPYLVFSTAMLFVTYHGGLYYFHRAMHSPGLFRRFHHVHHKYKAPMFLDALYEHPLEALYGGCVVVAPLFLFPVCMWGFLVFLSVMGLHEIIDHSGIDVNLPLLSRSWNHDEHHRRSNCFYGQLLPFLDDAHGTKR